MLKSRRGIFFTTMVSLKVTYQKKQKGQQVQTVIHKFYREGLHMAVEVIITTQAGKIYTDPGRIQVPRNENTESFYRMLESFKPKSKEETG